jgi:hypothetical protein
VAGGEKRARAKLTERVGSQASSDILPDEAVVVRGGMMELTTMKTNVMDHFYETGEYALSVWAIPDCDADNIARQCPIRHGKIRESTVGAIRRLGYDVALSGEFGHADVKFAAEPTDEDYEALRAVFSAPRPNPGRS